LISIEILHSCREGATQLWKSKEETRTLFTKQFIDFFYELLGADWFVYNAISIFF
jgi:hypothetical protein